ncbi:hypothetical protein [Microcystis aeruginosa]|nr:hypothetical protein [Microcystis aeruginosa]
MTINHQTIGEIIKSFTDSIHNGKWGSGEVGKWGSGEVGRWGGGEIELQP